MIFTDRKITIRNGKSTINEPVILYRGDFEVSIRFTIMESKFRFKSGVNLVDSEKASFGQLAILAPYGGNVFSEIVKCEDGTVTFTLTKEMIDQLEEVGLYSFQIRLFDYYRESRVSIPPVEFGIEVREPVASEDHDNSINNAIVGYSIAKVVDGLNENVGPTFDGNGNYNKTNWETGDRISQGKLNKIEDALDKINQNEMADVAALDKRVTNNFNVLESNKADKSEVNSKIWGMANMGQDVKKAMTGGSVAVVGENSILGDNIVDGQVFPSKINNTKTVYNLVNPKEMKANCYYNGSTGAIVEGTSAGGLNYITPLIPCVQGKAYYRNTSSNIILFDASRKFVGRADGGAISAERFSIPEDGKTAYMAFSFAVTDAKPVDKIYVVEGTKAMPATPVYRVEWPELAINELGISDVWLLDDEVIRYSIVGSTFTMDIQKGTTQYNPRMYLTYTTKPQIYIDLPLGVLKLKHNESWIFNTETLEFSVRLIGTDNGKWVDSSKNEICLLRNVNGRIVAGRLSNFVNAKMSGSLATHPIGIIYTGKSITLGATVDGFRTLTFSGGSFYLLQSNQTNKSISLNGGRSYAISVTFNTQLIWDTIDNTIKLENGNSNYSVKPHEVLLGYFQYGELVGGVILSHMDVPVQYERYDIPYTNIKGVYDRYENTMTIAKSDTTYTLTIDTSVANPWMVYVLESSESLIYHRYYLKGDVIVDEETGEETTLSTKTFVIPHNGMLLLDRNTSTYYVADMTKKVPFSVRNTNEVLLLLNIEGRFVAGELKDVFNDRLLKREMGVASSQNTKHDMGRLKFKFDVDPGGSYISSESLVGDEIWVFPVSNDEGTNFIKATRYKVDFENNTATEVGSFTHNWGHVNSSAYNPWRDALICGNGSGSYTLMGQIFIFENASSFKDRTQVNRSEAVTIDIQEWGYKANVVWGESNLGRGDICYVINNDAQNVRKLQLGMGANNLGSGVMLSGRNDNQFNGTYQVLGQWTLPRIDVVQGSNYENGALYIGLGHDTAWYTKNHLHDDGTVTYETYKEKFYNANGTQLKCNMQGITVTDKYIILGLQIGNGQIHVYHR